MLRKVICKVNYTHGRNEEQEEYNIAPKAAEDTKGHPPSADLRYGEEGSINPRTLVLAAKQMGNTEQIFS